MPSTRSVATVLVVLSLISTSLLVVGLFNYFDYSNPYSYVPTEPASLIDSNINPKANHTIIFVLDGVRADVFYNTPKPNIDSFSGWANMTNVQCSTLLSVSRAGYGVISSGVNTSESQIIANENLGAFTADSLWKCAIRHNETTAFVGSETWYELFGEWMNYSITFSQSVPGQAALVVNTTSGYAPVEEEIPAYSDELVSTYSIELVNSRLPTFTVIHFSETDEIGHENGTLSESYRDALMRQDTYIGEILSAYEASGILNSTLVIVTSDHGQTDFPGKGGEHGGIEPEVLHTPLLMIGPRVVPGIYNDLHSQTSIAPTVASIMGWEIPYDASGGILFETLDFSLREEAIYRINQAELRLNHAIARAQVMAYAGILTQDIDATNSQLIQAESNFTSGFYEQAIELAMTSEALSDSILRLSWYSKVNEETTFRFAILILFLGASFGVIYLFGRARQLLGKMIPEKESMGMIAISIMAYFVVLPLAALLSGWQFSASYLAAYFDELFFRLFAIALLPFVVTIVVLLLYHKYALKNQAASEVISSYREFILATSVLYLLGISFIIVFNGTGLPWYAQDVTIPLMYFFILISAISFTIYSVLTLVIGRILTKRIGVRSQN
ncbi:MAG: alkaline phosphatase family protein [Candidatus Thorarchaeota archaeon]